MTPEISNPLLLQPFTLRSLILPNRIMLSPMCQYSAHEGFASEWHLTHLAKFAAGGFGTVCVEATAVTRNGRLGYGDLGAWSDEHVPGLRRLADAIRSLGSVPAIQLGHSGRKGSTSRPWDGHAPLTDADVTRAEAPWTTDVPSADSARDAPPSRVLDEAGIQALQQAFVDAARRCDSAGFDIVEIHAAHGYLLHSFLSPISNRRTDQYGGSLENRMRLLLEITHKVRDAWPASKPVLVRCSAVDDLDGGWTIEDTVTLARELKDAGVDMMDCSSGGLTGSPTAQGQRKRRGLGFQLPYSEAVRREAGLPTVAVGLILDGRQAEAALQAGQADLIAIGREALSNPNWALHAARDLADTAGFDRWPEQYGWWLSRRASAMRSVGISHPDTKVM